MAQQQGLAFPAGAEGQEALANPAEPAQTHPYDSQSTDRPNSGKAFDQLRKFSSEQQHQKAAQVGGTTSRQAIFPAQVYAAHAP